MSFANIVLIVIIALGAMVAIHGIQIGREKRKPHVLGLEKTILTVVAPPNVKKMRQALGRMRVVYGVFLIVIALWALLQI